MQVINHSEIANFLDQEEAYRLQKEGFIAFAKGDVIQPPVAHLELDKGSLHIKYGMLKGDHHFVIKHATGFSGNWARGLATGDGFLCVFCAETGVLKSILLDQGFLTDLRTAIAVRISAEYFAPRSVSCVGVLGTGVQARLSAEQQAIATGCKSILVWGRNKHRVAAYQQDMEAKGFLVSIAESPDELLKKADLVITSASSRTPLLGSSGDVKTKLIVAVGCDEKGKQELDPQLFSLSCRVIGDNPSQCLQIGELQHSSFDESGVLTLGSMLHEPSPSELGLTIVDLTGLAVQDIQMANCIMKAMESDQGDRDVKKQTI